MQNKPIAKLMQAEMSRREFLAFLGGAVLAVFGVSTILRRMHGVMGDSSKASIAPYGGNRKFR